MKLAFKPFDRREIPMLRRYVQRALRQLQRRYGSQWITDVSVCRGFCEKPDPVVSAWLTDPDRCGWAVTYVDGGVWVFNEEKLRLRGKL